MTDQEKILKKANSKYTSVFGKSEKNLIWRYFIVSFQSENNIDLMGFVHSEFPSKSKLIENIKLDRLKRDNIKLENVKIIAISELSQNDYCEFFK